MIKLDENSTIIKGTNEDVQAEYLMLTEAILNNLDSVDRHVLFIATAREFVKTFGTNEEDE